VKIERYVFGIDATDKYRNSLFDAYAHYCNANEITWDRPRVKQEVAPLSYLLKRILIRLSAVHEVCFNFPAL
jgi:hypothetical protein